MLKSVQEKQRLVTGSRGWLAAASRQKMHTCQAWQKLKCHVSWSTTRQNRTTGRSVISWHSQAASQPCFEKPDSSHPFSPQYKYPLYPRKIESFQREFWEKNLRVKQDWFIHDLHIRDSSNSSTLYLSIVKSLRDFLPKPFLTISITMRGLFGVLRSS